MEVLAHYLECHPEGGVALAWQNQRMACVIEGEVAMQVEQLAGFQQDPKTGHAWPDTLPAKAVAAEVAGADGYQSQVRMCQAGSLACDYGKANPTALCHFCSQVVLAVAPEAAPAAMAKVYLQPATAHANAKA